MANKQLLDCVNEILKRVNIIAGNAGLLTTLTNSALQHNIDVAIQVVNEGIDELYTTVKSPLPTQLKESSLTLVTGTREYALPTDFVSMQWPLVDRTNNQFLFEWRDDYNSFLLLDPQQTYTGLSNWAMISPITGSLRLDKAPDSTVNGHIYFYEYEKNLELINSTDTVPFNNEVFRAMVPAWAMLYSRDMREKFDQSLYHLSMGRAARALTETPARDNYSPRG